MNVTNNQKTSHEVPPAAVSIARIRGQLNDTKDLNKYSDAWNHLHPDGRKAVAILGNGRLEAPDGDTLRLRADKLRASDLSLDWRYIPVRRRYTIALGLVRSHVMSKTFPNKLTPADLVWPEPEPVPDS